MSRLNRSPHFSARTQPPLSMSAYVFPPDGRHHDIAPDGDRFVILRRADTQAGNNDDFTGLIFIENWFQELTALVPLPV